MLFSHSIKFPRYSSIKQLEGLGNYAVKPYYTFPRRFFYRHKLKMIVDMMDKHYYPYEKVYKNILDFGAGSGIFYEELKRHCNKVVSYDYKDTLNPLWRFDLIVCASVLEFCELDFTLRLIKQFLSPKGQVIVASPMNTIFSRTYFKLLNDESKRHSHEKIMAKFREHFIIKKYKEWLGLYFACKAVAK